MAKRKEVLDAAPVEPVAAVPAPEKKNYVVNFRQLVGGKPRVTAWLPPTIKVCGCESPDDVRAKLHEMLDGALYQIEQARY